jgi:peptidoglycan/xylan/chitin deacetylase (PgdA/CDA1 family)
MQRTITIIIIGMFFLGCDNTPPSILLGCDNTPPSPLLFHSGVVLTFDDAYIDDWINAHMELKKFDWKATFFVSGFNKLNASEIDKLRRLKNHGHEIAGHGLNHVNAVNYISNYGSEKYLKDEIYPMKESMLNNGLYPTSFAYPYGARNSQLDNILLNEFRIIRATTYGDGDPSLHRCFYDNNNIVWGLGIDNSYGLSISYILSLLEYAKNEKKIIVFYAHKPVATVDGDYQTEYQRLIEICEYIKNNNMRFYSISDLYDIKR